MILLSLNFKFHNLLGWRWGQGCGWVKLILKLYLRNHSNNFKTPQQTQQNPKLPPRTVHLKLHFIGRILCVMGMVELKLDFSAGEWNCSNKPELKWLLRNPVPVNKNRIKCMECCTPSLHNWGGLLPSGKVTVDWSQKS